MRRLTHIDCDGWYVNDQSVAFDERRRGEEINRLATYEDIGTPEEINRIIDAYGRGLTLQTDASERLEIVKDIPTERLRGIAGAEKDGRLVTLPCGLRQPLYILEGKEIQRNYGCQWHFTDKECQTFGTLSMYGKFIRLDDFGKTVFLTREEAEAALKKREEADNEAD